MRTAAISVLAVLFLLAGAARLIEDFKYQTNASSPLRESEKIISGYKINLVPPLGFCELQKGIANDNRTLERVSQKLPKDTQVLLAFADCAQLDVLRQKGSASEFTYGLILAKKDGTRIRVEPGANRAEYLAVVVKASAEEDKSKGTGPWGNGTYTIERIEPAAQGLPPQDESAVYVGLIARPSDQRGGITTVSGCAITIINSIPLYIIISHDKIGDSSFSDLYRSVQGYATKLIAENSYIESGAITYVHGIATYKRPLTVGDLIMAVSAISIIALCFIGRREWTSPPPRENAELNAARDP